MLNKEYPYHCSPARSKCWTCILGSVSLTCNFVAQPYHPASSALEFRDIGHKMPLFEASSPSPCTFVPRPSEHPLKQTERFHHLAKPQEKLRKKASSSSVSVPLTKTCSFSMHASPSYVSPMYAMGRQQP